MGHSFVEQFFGNTIDRDLLALVTGKVLGEGIGRVVYEFKLRPELVMKIEAGSHSFQNILEWETWSNVREMKSVAKWFAPCEAISPCGTILLMRRTSPVSIKELPKSLPEFLTDCKVDNYGDLDGRLVCHDYGYTIIDYSMKQRKVHWWD